MAKSLPTARRRSPSRRRARSDQVGPAGRRAAGAAAGATAGGGGAAGAMRSRGRNRTGDGRLGQAAPGGARGGRPRRARALCHLLAIPALQSMAQPGDLPGQALGVLGPQPGGGRVGQEADRRLEGDRRARQLPVGGRAGPEPPAAALSDRARSDRRCGRAGVDGPGPHRQSKEALDRPQIDPLIPLHHCPPSSTAAACLRTAGIGSHTTNTSAPGRPCLSGNAPRAARRSATPGTRRTAPVGAVRWVEVRGVEPRSSEFRRRHLRAQPIAFSRMSGRYRRVSRHPSRSWLDPPVPAPRRGHPPLRRPTPARGEPSGRTGRLVRRPVRVWARHLLVVPAL